MISSIQKFLQKHHKWLLGSLLVVIIVAFVFTIGAAPGIGRKKSKSIVFFGCDLSDVRQVKELASDAVCSITLKQEPMSFDGIISRDKLGFEILKRAALLELCDEIGIPNPSEKQLRNYIRALPMLIGEDRKFSKELYSAMTEAFGSDSHDNRRLERVLCEDYRIGVMEDAISGPEMTFDIDRRVRDVLGRLETEYDFVVGTVFPNASDGQIEVTEDEVEAFYNKDPQRYVQLPMHYVSMIKFNSEKFLSHVDQPSDEELKKFFEDNRDKFSENMDFDEIKQHVLEAYMRARSTELAYEAAGDFAATLYEGGIKLNTSEFFRLLDKFGVEKEAIAAYTRKRLPSVNGVNSAYLLNACDLEGDRYFTEPYPATFGSVILLLEKRKESHYLTLDEARPAIRDDIARRNKRNRFTEKIEKIRQLLSDSVKDGGDVGKVFRENGIEYETFEGYSVRNAGEKKLDPLYQNAVFFLRGDEAIKLSAVNDDEVKIFVVTNKVLPPEKLESVEALGNVRKTIEQSDKNRALANFLSDKPFAEAKKIVDSLHVF